MGQTSLKDETKSILWNKYGLRLSIRLNHRQVKKLFNNRILFKS